LKKTPYTRIGVGHQLDNSIDIYTQDIGILPIVDGEQKYFNILVGGGLGSHHRQKQTFPRLADELGMCQEDQVLEVVRAIISIQRDHGVRTNRKQARMKYLLEDWGVEKFRSELELRLGFKLETYIKKSLTTGGTSRNKRGNFIAEFLLKMVVLRIQTQ
jgi:sulfite reductase (ferredoxin)